MSTFERPCVPDRAKPARALKQVVRAASTDEVHPALTRVLWSCVARRLHAAVTRHSSFLALGAQGSALRGRTFGRDH